MFKNVFVAGTIATTLFTTQSFAEINEDTIVVTATRTAQTIDETLAAVTVITREDIEKIQPNSVQELLSSYPGINIATLGGYGKPNSLFLRGTNAEHTLLLVNGIRQGSATNGSLGLQDINVDQIERIEIIRGPRSSLYGADAIGGVIQIFTNGKGNKINVEAGLGTESSHHINANLNMSEDNINLSAGIGSFLTDGINAKENSNPDRDGYRNNNANIQLGLKLTEQFSIDIHSNYTEGTNEYDGYSASSNYQADVSQQQLGLKLSLVSDSVDSKLSIAESRDESTNLQDGSVTSIFDTKRQMVSLQNDIYLTDDALFTIGIDTQRDMITSTSAYSETIRDNRALFMQYQGEFDSVSTGISFRHDDNEVYGHKNTANLSLGYDLSSSSKLRFAYGNAFRAPTFNDLFYPADANGSGNPALLSEGSKTTEIGIIQQQQGAGYELNLFRTSIDNLIAWACTLNCNDADWSNDFWQPSNVSKAEIKGAEFSLHKAIKQWQFVYNMTVTNAKDINTNKYLPRRAGHVSQFNLTHTADRLTTHINWLLQSHSFDNKSNSRRLPGFGLVDLALNYQSSEQLYFKLKIGNLFDKDYRTAYGYYTLGRTAYITAGYNF